MSQTALITGNSSGIGRITAELMARDGWQVVATSRAPEQLSSWARQNNLFALRLDANEEASVEETVQATLARFGRIDVLVNNAGYGLFGPLEGTTLRDIESYFRTNLLGALTLIKHVMPIMRAQHDGTIMHRRSSGRQPIDLPGFVIP